MMPSNPGKAHGLHPTLWLRPASPGNSAPPTQEIQASGREDLDGAANPSSPDRKRASDTRHLARSNASEESRSRRDKYSPRQREQAQEHVQTQSHGWQRR